MDLSSISLRHQNCPGFVGLLKHDRWNEKWEVFDWSLTEDLEVIYVILDNKWIRKRESTSRCDTCPISSQDRSPALQRGCRVQSRRFDGLIRLFTSSQLVVIVAVVAIRPVRASKAFPASIHELGKIHSTVNMTNMTNPGQVRRRR